MTEQTPPRISRFKLVAIAVLLGLLAGAGAVYVKLGGSGNALEQTASVKPANLPGCDAAKSVAAALKPYATGQVAAMTPQATPRQMQGLAFNSAGGKPMTLAAYKGKTLLVNIWATWCVPCREEIPALDKLEAKRGGKDFQVISINIDTGDPSKPVKFFKQVGASHLVLHRDPSMGVFDELKKEGLAFGLPVTLLVGRNGCLLAAMNGPAEWAGADALRLVKTAVDLQAKPGAANAPKPS